MCQAGDVVLTLEQAANAATIAAVGKRVGMSNHAVTVALATAFQESGLRNLPYGDRDSLGLFQQRPSQGWGSAATVQTPRLAAGSFYRHLNAIPGWSALPVTEAAQRVQRSAAPDAYGRWEDSSRQLAQALTGEVAAGLSCSFARPPGPPEQAQVQAAAVADLGPGGLRRTSPEPRAWTTASWLVAHASSYGITTVSMSGRTWTAKQGRWRADQQATGLRWA